MNYSSIYVDELAAAEHRQELEEQARVERLIAEHAPQHPDKKHSGLIWRLLHLRQPEIRDEDVRRN